jgi:hypothetical protein
LRWIEIDEHDTSNFDGLTEVSYFFNEFELNVPKQQILLELDVSLIATIEIWWETHKEWIEDWKHCKRMMQIIFGMEYIMHKYTGMSDPKDHISECIMTWTRVSKQEWMHRFIHTL